MPCNEMSADWAAQRIKGLSLGKAVVDGLKRSLGLNKRPTTAWPPRRCWKASAIRALGRA
jgi:hypothetical protein